MKSIDFISFLCYWISFNFLLEASKEYFIEELAVSRVVFVLLPALALSVYAFRRNKRYLKTLKDNGKERTRVPLWVILFIIAGVCLNFWGVLFGQRTH